MSFHFNLSSSSDESGDDEEEQAGLGGDIRGSPLTTGGERASATSGAFGWGGGSEVKEEEEEEEEDDDDGIDWEDAEDDGEVGDDLSAKADGAAAASASTKVSASAAAASSSKRKMPTQGIIIDFGSAGADEKKVDGDDDGDGEKAAKRRRKKIRKLNKIQGLPPHMVLLVQSIHRSHMLCLSSRAVFISSLCSDDELLNLAHSLLPTDLVGNPMDPILPSEDTVRSVLAWFFELVNDVELRRRRIREENAAMGAPRQRGRGDGRGRGRSSRRRGSNGARRGHGNGFSSTHEGPGCTDHHRLANLLQYYSSANDSDPGVIGEEQKDAIGGEATPHEKTQLLVLVTRSLGWRVRYVTAMQPISKELTVNHPLFAGGLKDVFLRVMASGNTRALQKTKKDLEGKGADVIDLAGDSNGDEHNHGNRNAVGAVTHQGDVLAWVEILCTSPAHRTKRKAPAVSSTSSKPNSSTARWVHVDCERKIVDQPSAVEKILARFKSGDESGPRTKQLVSYVLGVEHNSLTAVSSGRDVHLYCRVTDVTRRYAGAWSQTLRLRGASGQQIVKSGGKCIDSWWGMAIRKVNRLAKRKARKFLLRVEAGSIEAGQTVEKAGGEKKPRRRSKTSSQGPTDSSGKPENAIVIGDSSDSESEDDRKPAASVSISSASNFLDEDEHENAEKKELAASAADEAIPTSKAAFKKHPLYALASNLNKAEVIDPAGKKRIVGIFKGELIYHRSDISVALTTKKWLYQGRKVREAELSKPAKKVKALKKTAPKTFRALTSYGVSDTSEQKVDDESYEEDDGMDHIYGLWQTEEWSPDPVGPNDEIPVNEYKNIELALINPGLIYLEVRGIAKVAKKLEIPYAPCLLGFEGHGGNRIPTIRGIVVHEHNADLLRCAYTEWESQAVEQEHTQRRKAIYGRWKRLIVGILTKERLDRQYGGEENE